MQISCELKYSSPEVVTFDPEKVMRLLAQAFPEAIIDPRDQSAVEVEQLRAHLDCRPDMSADAKDQMLRQIQGKARRNGPVFAFRLPAVDAVEIRGTAGRYAVNFIADGEIPQPLCDRVFTFLHSLRIGKVVVADSEGEPHDVEFVKRLASLSPKQRRRFYESFASNLTVSARVIAFDDDAPDSDRVHQLGYLNEIMHQVLHRIASDADNGSDADMWGHIRHWCDQEPSVTGHVGWAIRASFEGASDRNS